MATDSIPALWDVQRTADFLGTSVPTIYSWAERGIIPSHKLGRLLRFDPEEVIAWARSQAAGGGSR